MAQVREEAVNSKLSTSIVQLSTLFNRNDDANVNVLTKIPEADCRGFHQHSVGLSRLHQSKQAGGGEARGYG